jgi:hypothetical protein
MGEAEGNIGCERTSIIGVGQCLSIGSAWKWSFAAPNVDGAALMIFPFFYFSKVSTLFYDSTTVKT